MSVLARRPPDWLRRCPPALPCPVHPVCPIHLIGHLSLIRYARPGLANHDDVALLWSW